MENSELTIKKGYKQTEVGIIPEDWNVSTIGREFEIKLGKMLDAEKNVGTLKPYLGNKSVQWNRIDLDESQTMAMTQADLKRFRLRHGDLLVCEGGEVGRAAIWESPIEECYYQKALHRLRPLRKFNTKLFLEFLHYWTDHEMLGNYISQTSIAHLTREKFAEVPLPIPPLPEQQAIAEVLSDVDALITSLDQLISKKRNIKQGTMQLLLTGKKRLPNFSGDWEMKTLGEIADVIMGQSPSSEFYNQEGIGLPLIQGNADIENRKTIVRIYTSSITKKCVEGDIIMSVRAPVGEIARATFNACIGRGVCAIRYKNDYLYHYLNFSEIAWLKLSKGSTFDSVNSKEVKEFELNLPPTIEEQKAIVQILSEMNAEIEALETRRDKYKAVKQGMMQELLTGKTRLV